jgi:WD40 repeat protein
VRAATALFVLFLSLSIVSAQSSPRGPVITPDNANQLQLITTLGRGQIFDLLWTPDEKRLIVVSTNALSVYTVGDWESPLIVAPERPALVDAALAPDGQTIVLVEHNLIRVLDTTTWAERLRIETDTYQRGGRISTIAHMGDYFVYWNPVAMGFVIRDAHTGEMIETVGCGGEGEIINGSEAFSAVEQYRGQLRYGSLAREELFRQEGDGVFVNLEGMTYEQVQYFRGIDYHEQILAVTGIQGKQGYLFVDDLARETRLAEITTGRFGAIALSPQDDHMAAGLCMDQEEWCRDFQVALMNFAGDEQTLLPGRLRGSIAALRYSASGRFLAAANSTAVRVWDTTTQEALAELPGFSTSTTRIAVNDTYLAVANSGVTLWELDTLTSVAYLPSCGGAIALSDNQLVCGGEVWSVDTMPPRLLYTIPGAEAVRNVAFSTDGSLLAIVDYDHQLLLWDVNDQVEVAVVYGIRLWEIRFSPDDCYLLAYDHGGSHLLMWDIARLRAEAQPVVLPDLDEFSPEYDDLAVLPFVTPIPAIGKSVYALAVHPDGLENTLLYGYDGDIRVVDVATNEEKLVIPYWSNVTMHDFSMTYNPSADLIAGARCSDSPVGGYCVHSDVQVFDAVTGESLFTEERDWDQIEALAFTRDGRWLLTGHSSLDGMMLGPAPDANIHIWGIPDS